MRNGGANSRIRMLECHPSEFLLLRKGDLQGHIWSDHEALQAVPGNARLLLVAILDEGHVAALDEACLLKSRVLPEEHGQHEVVHLCRQVLHKKHVGWLAVAGRRPRGPSSRVLRHLWLHLLGLCCGESGNFLGPGCICWLAALLCAWLPSAVFVGYDVRLGPAVSDLHWLVEEHKAVQRTKSVGGARNVRKDDKCLTLPLQRTCSDHVKDLTVAGEEL
mmetsp:Transcript_30620/g.49115  ORF Transcript_30620/g.49115 Transcript_30620/m.49115 type:complete len:219 (+) Transcript_30620:83-739(+)